MIRRMEPCHLEQTAWLEKVCFSENWSYQLLEAGIHSLYDVYYVWEQESRILGYCCLRLLAGEGEIQRIAVLPEYRRLGIGRKMMEAMVNYATKNQAYAISLEVREAILLPAGSMNPLVLRQRPCAEGITTILWRML